MREELDGLKVTAYALGELEEDERLALEARIAAWEGGRAEVEEIRQAAAALREAYGAMPRYELTPAQRQAIEAAAARAADVPARRRRWPGASRVAGFAAVAAAVMVAGLAVSVPSLLRARVSVARRDGATPPLPASRSDLADRRFALAPLAHDGAEQLKTLGYLGGKGDKDEAAQLREPSSEFNTEAYDYISDNPFVLVAQDPRSTFSVDVDTASYAIVRRFLNEGRLPPKDAVRIEELINYFPYAYAPPTDGRPFAVHMDAVACPWKEGHRLVRIGIKGREIPPGQRPPSNLVFLLDVSGSMDAPNKLPLVKAAMRLLVEQLGPGDRVAIVVYAGSEGLALGPTRGSDKTAILSAIESLSPGGTTHGSAGIRLAYETAADGFIDGGVNRVILATDGDFNVGVTNQGDLVRLIEEKARGGVFLTALGFGMGNLKDSTLEKLADHGNGNYAYIDSLAEARKVLVEQAGGTLVTIAKDVKLQVEFNPRRVKAFRLIGYENRMLAHQDFNDDTKDAGDIGAGHTVTALYEIVPPGGAVSVPGVDPLKYQQAPRPVEGPDSGELLTVKLRYKEPDGQRSSLVEAPLADAAQAFAGSPDDLRFAASVAAFGMVLRDSPHKGRADLGQILDWAQASVGEDRGGLRAEFLQLVEKARSLSPKR